MRPISTLTALIVAYLCSQQYVQAAEPDKLYKLIFPSFKLNKEQYQAMEELNFTLACGHIKSISWVPDIWNVQITRAVSATEELHASAGLGSARLAEKDINNFSGAITIIDPGDNCFKLSGSIIIGGKQYFEIPLSNANLLPINGSAK